MHLCYHGLTSFREEKVPRAPLRPAGSARRKRGRGLGLGFGLGFGFGSPAK